MFMFRVKLRDNGLYQNKGLVGKAKHGPKYVKSIPKGFNKV
jgi:hypothetical protein